MNIVKGLATQDLDMSCYMNIVKGLATLSCMENLFLLVNYILLSKKFIVSKLFLSIPPKIEYILMVRP